MYCCNLRVIHFNNQGESRRDSKNPFHFSSRSKKSAIHHSTCYATDVLFYKTSFSPRLTKHSSIYISNRLCRTEFLLATQDHTNDIVQYGKLPFIIIPTVERLRGIFSVADPAFVCVAGSARVDYGKWKSDGRSRDEGILDSQRR